MTPTSSNPIRIGLTGGIGCGKTTVCNLFEELGIDIIDADIIAREIVEPNEAAYQQIKNLFPNENILDSNQQIDRKKLRKLVFTDSEKLTELERITHPAIIKSMQDKAARSTSAYCILCLPLLFEKNLQEEVDRVLVIDIPSELQKERASVRDGSCIEQIEAIINHQIDREKRVALADDIITNTGSIDELKPQVSRLHEQYLSMGAEKFSTDNL